MLRIESPLLFRSPSRTDSQHIVIIYSIFFFLLSLKLWFCDIFCIVFWHLLLAFIRPFHRLHTWTENIIVIACEFHFFRMGFKCVSIFLMIGNWKYKIAQRKNCLMPRKKKFFYTYIIIVDILHMCLAAATVVVFSFFLVHIQLFNFVIQETLLWEALKKAVTFQYINLYVLRAYCT